MIKICCWPLPPSFLMSIAIIRVIMIYVFLLFTNFRHQLLLLTNYCQYDYAQTSIWYLIILFYHSTMSGQYIYCLSQPPHKSWSNSDELYNSNKYSTQYALLLLLSYYQPPINYVQQLSVCYIKAPAALYILDGARY